MPTCPSCGLENPADARFCNRCGSALGDAARASATAEVRKTVTVLFTDVTGSTDMGERLDPEALRRVMGRYFDRMQAVVERHGGTVEKFIGDAVMAVFGIPVLHEDDALRALRAASDMRAELVALNKELERDIGVTIATRTGVHTGEVVAGDPASGQRLATGDAVNIAARLEQAAAPGEILIGEPTFRLARAAVVAEPVEPLELKGKERPVPAYRLLEVLADVDAIERHLDSPMVGRDDELRLLDDAFRRSARERTAVLFTVLGAAGVGKSRLVGEFVELVGEEGRVLRGRCLAYGDGITYWPLAEIVKDAARITEHDPPDEAVARIRALLPGSDDQAGVIATRVAEAIGVIEGATPAEEIAWATRRMFESLAADRPLVVVFDDIHWAEPTLLDLIEHVADWSRDAPVLLLCLARQELLDLRPAWGGGKLNATTIQLEPLTDDQAGSLLENLLASELDEGVRGRIAGASEGNPLFVEQMVSMLIDDGFLERQGDRWVTAGDLGDASVPPTIHALVAARLDRLGAEERSVVERAAVEGKVFHVGAVSALFPDEVRPDVRRHLMTLTRRELIRPDRPEFRGEEAFRFRHQLIRDATYQAVPKEARADLHERFADWLVKRVGDAPAEYEEIVGYHLEQAVRYRRELRLGPDSSSRTAARASVVLASAGRRAAGRGDFPAAMKLLDRARGLAVPVSRQLVEICLDLEEAAAFSGEFGLSERAAADAVASAEAMGDQVLLARARISALDAIASTDSGRLVSEGPAVLDRAIPILEAAGDDWGLARAWGASVSIWNNAADRTRMGEGFDRAIEHARRAGDRAHLVQLLASRTANDYWGPLPAREGLARAAEVLEEIGDSRTLGARAQMYRAGLLGMLGRFDEAHAALEETRAVYREVASILAATTSFVVGPLELWAGDLPAAEAELRANCEALQRMGERSWLCSIAMFLADILYREGRDDEAAHWLEVGHEAAADDDLSAQADWRCVRAKLLSREGRFDEAEALVREGLATIQRTDEIEHIADAWADLYEVLRMAGRPDEAAEAAREAIATYERKENVAAASNLRRELAGEA